MSASLAEEAEDVYEVVCDFGDAVCDYADSDIGKAVDVIAKIGARAPGQVGAASRASRRHSHGPSFAGKATQSRAQYHMHC